MFVIPPSLALCTAVLGAAPPAQPAGRATPPSTLAPATDRGDDQYNFIAGLYDRGLHSMVVKESEKFLSEFGQHQRVPLVRYRMGQSLFELKRFEEARDALRPLDALGDRFQYRREAAFRIAQCSLELGDAEDAAKRFEGLTDDPSHYLFASAAYFAGEALFQRESYAAAARSYAKVLEGRADQQLTQGALYGLGWSLYRSQQYETAAKTLQLFLTRFPNDAAVGEIRFLQGESLTQIRKHKEALNAYLGVPQGDYYDDALSAAGFAAAELGQHKNAAQLFLRLEKEAPDSELLAEGRLHAGIQSVRASNLPQAGVVLDRLLASEGSEEWHAEARYWRGQVAAKTEGPEAAIGHYDRGSQGTRDPELLRRLKLAKADALFDAQRFDEAQAIYAEMESGASDALYSSAVAALNAGQPDVAIQRARKLLKDDPDSPHALGARLVEAEGLFAKEDHAAASVAFEKIEPATRAGNGAAAHPERPRVLSRWAWSLFYREKYAEAAARFSQLGNEFPRDERAAEASFLEGRCLLRAGQFAKAENILAQHLKAYAGTGYDSDARYDLAQAMLEQGKEAEAQQMLASVADDDAGLGMRARYEQAELAAQAGDDEKAVRLLEPVVGGQNVPQDLLRASLYSHAWSCFALGRLPQARQSLRKLLGTEGLAGDTEPSALELLTTVEQRSGNPDGAVQAYEFLRDKYPDGPRTPEVALQAAIALKEGKRNPDAAALLKEAATRWPRFGGRDRILYELAFLHRAMQEEDQYLARLAEIETRYAQSPLAADAAFYRAEALFEDEDYAAAEKAYARALDEDSRVRDLARYKTGWCAFRADRMDDAAGHFRQLHQQHPDSPLAGEALFLAGECLYQKEDYEAAGALLARFVADFPSHETRPKGLFRLGLCHGENEQFQACLDTLGTLEREAPDFEHRLEAGLWIGRALLANGQLDDADRRFGKVLDGDRGILAARAHLGRGQVLIARDKIEDALGEFLKVVLLYTDVPEAAEALWQSGRCLERLGDRSRAAQQYRDLLTKHPDHPRVADARARLAELESGGTSEGGV